MQDTPFNKPQRSSVWAGGMLITYRESRASQALLRFDSDFTWVVQAVYAEGLVINYNVVLCIKYHYSLLIGLLLGFS